MSVDVHLRGTDAKGGVFSYRSVSPGSSNNAQLRSFPGWEHGWGSLHGRQADACIPALAELVATLRHLERKSGSRDSQSHLLPSAAEVLDACERFPAAIVDVF